ncbi:hypothetical protein N7414_20050 [Pseudomonas sp. GD04087]|uniref:hypothetical protein n=1 Tax=unclassified Pseudomonas TaxID=196821 RepID=UPI00244C9888|nr:MULTISPECIES: hypothetical protein [unclassified Pseudomonas]MDH0291424.1 hypothetical protein [Pseudomonas sp. GD04087]MDH1051736.1 hypothetical protein [Pseudomonas sp. GD03903]MDH2001730.1 hypothetical protein [Pseudomonas sp. GD03691]
MTEQNVCEHRENLRSDGVCIECGEQVPPAFGEIGADGWRKLGQPAMVGGVIFSPKLSSRLVVEAAQRHHEYSQQPEVEAERLERLRDLLKSVHAAPSQADPVHHQLVHNISAFALDLIRGAGEGGSFDGGCIQDLAVKHGLMTIEECEEPCSDEGCACAQYGFPSQCYRIKLEVLAIEQIAKAQGEKLSPRPTPEYSHE